MLKLVGCSHFDLECTLLAGPVLCIPFPSPVGLAAGLAASGTVADIVVAGGNFPSESVRWP